MARTVPYSWVPGHNVLRRITKQAAFPPSIVEKIIAGNDPAVSTLKELCGESRQWRKNLFCKRYLVYVDSGNLHVFHCTETSWWETVSLQFCEKRLPGLNLDKLQLVFSKEGLLCLSTGVEGEFIFCNPLTRRCDRVCTQAVRPISGISVSSPLITWWSLSAPGHSLKQLRESPFSSVLLKARIHYADSLRKFRLTVSYTRSKPLWIAVYKVHNHRRKRLTEVPNNLTLFLRADLALFPEGGPGMNLGFGQLPDGNDFQCMAYDPSSGKLRWINNGISPLQALAKRGEEHFLARIRNDEKIELSGLFDDEFEDRFNDKRFNGNNLEVARVNDSDFVLTGRFQTLTGSPDGEVLLRPQLMSVFFIKHYVSTKPTAINMSMGNNVSPAKRVQFRAIGQSLEKNVRMKLIQFREDGVNCWVSNLRRTTEVPLPLPKLDCTSVMMQDAVNHKCLLSDWTEWNVGVDLFSRIAKNFHVWRPQFQSTLNVDLVFKWTGLGFPACATEQMSDSIPNGPR